MHNRDCTLAAFALVAAMIGCQGTTVHCDAPSLPRVFIDGVPKSSTPWHVELVRGRGFSSDSTLRCATNTVPVHVAPDTQPRNSLPFVVIDTVDGRFLVGEWDGAYTAAAGQYAALALGFRHLIPGRYYGDLLLPAKAGGTITVPVLVRVTDWVIWPSLVIFLGVLLSSAMQQYRASVRAYMLLRMRVDRIPAILADANADFVATLRKAVHDPPAWSIDGDVTREVAVLSEQLDALRLKGGALDATNPECSPLLIRLSALEDAIAQWPRVATDLVALIQALADARTALQGMTRPATSSTPPGADPPIIQRAVALGGTRQVDVAGVAETRETVRDATTMLAEWRGAVLRVGALFADITSAVQQAGGNVAVQNAIRAVESGSAAGVWQRLYDVSDGPALRLLLTDGSIDRVAAALRAAITGNPVIAGPPTAVAAAAPVGPSAPVQTQAAKLRAAVAAAIAAYRQAGASGLTDAQRSAQLSGTIRQQILFLDAGFFLFTLATAVVTGLSQLYYGKPFGSVEDYLLAFVWGFGTKTLVDAAVGGLNRVVGGNAAVGGTPSLSGPPLAGPPSNARAL